MRVILPLVTVDGVRRPDVTEDVTYSIVEQHADGTVTVEVGDAYFQPARDVAARLVIEERLDTLPLSTVPVVATLFDDWQPGGTYPLGAVRRWDGTLIRCLQAHTNSDPNHTPDVTPALWTIYRTAPAEEYPAWVQPESTKPYNATWDDGTGPVIVTHNGRLWENVHGDGNVWEPGFYGWADLGPVSTT